MLDYLNEVLPARAQGTQPRSPRLIELAADLVLRYATADTSGPHQTVNRRMALAACLYVEAVHPTRKKAA